jgi:hypothetical protein
MQYSSRHNRNHQPPTPCQQPSINAYYHPIPTTHPKRNHGKTDPPTPPTSHQTFFLQKLKH